MKRVYKLKSGARAAVHAFKTGDFSGVDRISEHNDNILRDVFKRVQFGLSEYAFINTGNDNGGMLVYMQVLITCIVVLMSSCVVAFLPGGWSWLVAGMMS